jgi:hypothetical protein
MRFEKYGLAIYGVLMRDLSHTYRFVFDWEITEGRLPQEKARSRSLPPRALFPQESRDQKQSGKCG